MIAFPFEFFNSHVCNGIIDCTNGQDESSCVGFSCSGKSPVMNLVGCGFCIIGIAPVINLVGYVSAIIGM